MNEQINKHTMTFAAYISCLSAQLSCDLPSLTLTLCLTSLTHTPILIILWIIGYRLLSYELLNLITVFQIIDISCLPPASARTFPLM